MLLHSICQTPVRVVEEGEARDQETVGILAFYCEVCEEVVWDDHLLSPVDELSFLETSFAL